MNKLVQELLTVLQQQSECYNKLLEFAVAKRPVLVEGKLEELDDIVKKEEVLIFEVGRLEEKRSKVHQALANHFSLSPDALTASELGKRIEPDTAAQISGLFEKMVNVLNELEGINKTNTDLIQNSLDYVNFYLNMLTSDNDVPAYDDKDDRKNGPRARIFDHKI